MPNNEVREVTQKFSQISESGVNKQEKIQTENDLNLSISIKKQKLKPRL